MFQSRLPIIELWTVLLLLQQNKLRNTSLALFAGLIDTQSCEDISATRSIHLGIAMYFDRYSYALLNSGANWHSNNVIKTE